MKKCFQLIIEVVYLLYVDILTKYLSVYQLKVAHIYYLAQFLRVRYREWLSWVFLVQTHSRGYPEAICQGCGHLKV